MGPIKRNNFKGPLSGINNEQGAALLIVLVMLMLLTILSATLFTSSISEIRIAGNYRNSLETFSAADAAVEFALTYSNIYTSLFGTTTSWPTAGSGKVFDESFNSTEKNSSDPYKDYNQITIPGTNNKAQVKVELVKKGPPPVGQGYQEDAGLGSGGGFKANIFAVSVIANGPNNARADIEAGAARIVPQ
jgi:hypothetical protein